MQDLKMSNPIVYQHFLDGFHVVRRTDRDWAGLSTDFVIEQELMRNLKTSGGLTRGAFRGGFTETQLQQWVLSRPTCLGIHSDMQCILHACE